MDGGLLEAYYTGKTESVFIGSKSKFLITLHELVYRDIMYKYFSLSVGVKMNILMFAPALFLAFIATGGLKRAATQVSICALVQLVIGFPFLTTYPIEYIKGSFDIGRVFLFEWTVNWRFLPEEIFVHKGFHITLLMIHLMVE